MSENNKPQVDNRTASQKLADMENALVSLYQTADNMARDLMTLKEAVKLLGNKVDSIVKASASGEALNDEVISRIMVQNNVEELKQKVQNMVTQGLLASQDQVDDNSFVVGEELNDAGEVVNPRLQFALRALPQPEVREKIKGGKVGETITVQEGKFKFKVLEVYQIQQPGATAAPEQSLASEPEAEVAPPEEAPTANA